MISPSVLKIKTGFTGFTCARHIFVKTSALPCTLSFRILGADERSTQNINVLQCMMNGLTAGYGLSETNYQPELIKGLIGWGHGGDGIGYTSICLYLLDHGMSIDIMKNTNDGNVLRKVLSSFLNIIKNDLEETPREQNLDLKYFWSNMTIDFTGILVNRILLVVTVYK